MSGRQACCEAAAKVDNRRETAEPAAFAAVYIDRGITPGMAEGIERHKRNGLAIVERRLGGGWAK